MDWYTAGFIHTAGSVRPDGLKAVRRLRQLSCSLLKHPTERSRSHFLLRLEKIAPKFLCENENQSADRLYAENKLEATLVFLVSGIF